MKMMQMIQTILLRLSPSSIVAVVLRVVSAELPGAGHSGER